MSATLQAVGLVVKSSDVQFVTLGSEEFAEVDHAYGLVTFWHGVHTGDEKDWGYPVASVPLAFLVDVAKSVQSSGVAA